MEKVPTFNTQHSAPSILFPQLASLNTTGEIHDVLERFTSPGRRILAERGGHLDGQRKTGRGEDGGGGVLGELGGHGARHLDAVVADHVEHDAREHLGLGLGV